MKKRICILYTGGTIGMMPSEQGYAPRPGCFAGGLAAIPELTSPDMPDWELVEMDPLLDSSNITVHEWCAIGLSKIDSPTKYLYRCVRNAALDYASTHRLRRWEELNGKEVIADEVNFDLSRDDVERANRLHRLYQAIERLSEQSRKVVKLICLNNYSYADAASELGVSLATIKTHMYRSIKALRKFMALFIF